ncbi:MAG: hypothetical protein R2761_06620 [Acidimicrobiales bacterium]
MADVLFGLPEAVGYALAGGAALILDESSPVRRLISTRSLRPALVPILEQ